ncbi:MAG: hypothetical protein IJV15_11925 [Lachnospiraceae bacterium]|nr:hypothetical protein [Lachnospiraceae bacterium]
MNKSFFSIISVLCIVTVMVFSPVFDLKAEEKGEPVINPLMISITEPETFPDIAVGTEGIFKVKYPVIKGYEDIEIEGTVRFEPVDSDIIRVDESGRYVALSEGTEQLFCEFTVSEDTFKLFEDKYGVELSVLETSAIVSFTINVIDNSSSIEIYRLYNPNSGEHFYTSNEIEKDNLSSLGWKYEGVAWDAPETSDIPVYRLYNPNAGDHHYTIDEEEKEKLVDAGWEYECISWYSYTDEGKELYRMYNPNAKSGAHHFTLSNEERDMLIANGWKFEGIAWYGN